jgi:hypothetical protein
MSIRSVDVYDLKNQKFLEFIDYEGSVVSFSDVYWYQYFYTWTSSTPFHNQPSLVPTKSSPLPTKLSSHKTFVSRKTNTTSSTASYLHQELLLPIGSKGNAAAMAAIMIYKAAQM